MTEHAPIVLDVAGSRLDANDRRRLAHPLTGGLILFARHFESRAQLVALVAEAKAIRPDLLVCVDHEGGRVMDFGKYTWFVWTSYGVFALFVGGIDLDAVLCTRGRADLWWLGVHAMSC